MSPGTILAGRYRLERKLGQGGMGAVYAATDLTFRRSVAIKMLLPDAAADREQSSRFELEARAVASLGHPHIAALLDFHAAADPSPFLVMELLEGETLRALLGRERALPPARAVHIVRQILLALGAAHRAGIIHRDIKPSNVMLLRSGAGADLVKLVDFGVAKMAEGTTRRHHTVDGSVIGTLQYMPPEQAQGLPVTMAADLYAVGVCLFEMIAGYNPFAVGEMPQVFLAVRDLLPPDLRQVRADVPSALALATARALSKSPQARFGSADEMAAALEHAPSSFTTAGPPSFATAGPPSFTTAGPPSFTTAGPPSLLAPAPAPARATGRGVLWLIVILLVALLGVGGAVVALLLRAPQPPPVAQTTATAPPSVAAVPAPAPSASASSPAPPPSRPAAARPTPNRSDGAPVKPRTGSRCVCRPESTAPDSSNLCRLRQPTKCVCESNGAHYRLCQVPHDAKLNCPDGSNDYRNMPTAHHGDACSGFANDRDPKIAGALLCSVCATASYPGNDGEACVGYHAELGTQWKGTLAGCE